jgi:hypothetical protein
MQRPLITRMTAQLSLSGRARTLSESGAASGWKVAHIGFENEDFTLGGLSVWKSEWRKTSEAPIRLWHPAYPEQLHDFRICEIGDASAPVRFAVCELSNGVYGFFVPE